MASLAPAKTVALPGSVRYSETALSGIYEISKIVTSPSSLRVMFNEVVSVMSSSLDIRLATLMLLNKEGDPEIKVAASAEAAKDFERGWRPADGGRRSDRGHLHAARHRELRRTFPVQGLDTAGYGQFQLGPDLHRGADPARSPKSLERWRLNACGKTISKSASTTMCAFLQWSRAWWAKRSSSIASSRRTGSGSYSSSIASRRNSPR